MLAGMARGPRGVAPTPAQICIFRPPIGRAGEASRTKRWCRQRRLFLLSGDRKVSLILNRPSSVERRPAAGVKCRLVNDEERDLGEVCQASDVTFVRLD